MLGQGWRKEKWTFDKTRQPYQKPIELGFIIKPNGILLYEWFITWWRWLARAKTKSPNIIINCIFTRNWKINKMDPFLIFWYFNQYKNKKFPMKFFKRDFKNYMCLQNNIQHWKQHINSKTTCKMGGKKIIL